MAELLKGAPVARALTEELAAPVGGGLFEIAESAAKAF